VTGFVIPVFVMLVLLLAVNFEHHIAGRLFDLQINKPWVCILYNNHAALSFDSRAQSYPFPLSFEYYVPLNRYEQAQVPALPQRNPQE
jgi:hypothetical protein